MIRPYRHSDYDALHALMRIEGIKDTGMDIETTTTYVMEDGGDIKGFYSYRIEGVFPHLQHFCVDRQYRGGSVARALIGSFKAKVLSEGYAKAIVNVCSRDTLVEKIVQRYFGAKSYAEKNGMDFYLVAVA